MMYVLAFCKVYKMSVKNAAVIFRNCLVHFIKKAKQEQKKSNCVSVELEMIALAPGDQLDIL